MLSRNLVSAAVLLLTACLVKPAGAQNLEAGKTPSQIFAQTCSLCHKSSRKLLKTVPPGSLAGFLRQHYTTSADMASMLSAYILSNGASDPRIGGDNLTNQGKEARSGPGPESRPSEAKPSEGGIFGRLFESKPFETKPPAAAEPKPEQKPVPERRTREASRPDVDGRANAVEPQAGAEAVPEEARAKGKKQKHDNKKLPVSTARQEPNASPPDAVPPAATAKTEPAGETNVRPDPEPSVTLVPGATEPAQKSAEEKSSNMPVFNLEPPPQAEAVPAEPPRAPAGPPVVPISQ